MCLCILLLLWTNVFDSRSPILALNVLAHTSAEIQGVYNGNFQDGGQILIHLLHFL